MKNDFFKLKDHGTTVRREVLAGITTFMTMAYVLAVQPSAICGFGPDPYITDINGIVISKSALLVMCALVSGIITLFMGLYANLPLALSTAMGSNFILGGLVNSGTVSFGWAMALLLCSGILFILVTVLGVRKMVVDLLPKNLKIARPPWASLLPIWALKTPALPLSATAVWLWAILPSLRCCWP